MLMLRPIQLNTAMHLAAASESFCARLAGNYGLMSAHVAPKDLLFFLSSPPAFPEDLGGGVSLSIQTALTDVRNVTMDVVNNVVNRILVAYSPHFTYQDQVYVATVLRKLGVSDVSRFMEEVRALREEQRSVMTLTGLYRQEVTRRALTALKGEAGPITPQREAFKAGEAPPTRAERYYLHEEVYRRLETGAVYRETAALRQSVLRLGDQIEHNELKLSEQLRVSRSLTLSELKRQNSYGGSITLRHHVNRYERGDFLPPPATEGEVLAQAAQAALLSVVDQVTTQVLERRAIGGDCWFHLERSLGDTVENTLNRFESYHTARSPSRPAKKRSADLYESLYREETRALESLSESWTLRERLTRTSVPGRQGEAGEDALSRTALHHTELTHPRPVEGASPTFRETLSREEHQTRETLIRDRTPPERLTRPGASGQPGEPGVPGARPERPAPPEAGRADVAPAPGRPSAPPYKPPDREIADLTGRMLAGPPGRAGEPGQRTTPPLQTMLESVGVETREQTLRAAGLRAVETLRELAGLERELIAAEQEPPVVRENAAANLPPIPPAGREREGGRPAVETPRRYPPAELTFSADRGPTEEIAGETAEATAPKPAEPPPTGTLQLLRREILRRTAETRFFAQSPGESPKLPRPGEEGRNAETETPPPAQTALPTPEEAPELLVQALSEIDRENRERLERLRESHTRRETAMAGPPDVKRTMAEALRVLEEPGPFSREVKDPPLTPEHPALPPELQAALQAVDPPTRRIYETLLRYQQDPASVPPGLIQPGSVGAFNVEAARREARTAELRHPAPPSAGEGEAAAPESIPRAGLPEYRRENPRGPHTEVRRRGEWSKAPTVLKLEDNRYMDELVERLEERRRQSDLTRTLRDESTHTSANETQINDVSRQVMTHSTEDITALVNRTMARQMNALTDRVYRQMEKKLQTERSRRGR